jgi:hypothetical protein
MGGGRGFPVRSSGVAGWSGTVVVASGKLGEVVAAGIRWAQK